jgi:hypothetical protein
MLSLQAIALPITVMSNYYFYSQNNATALKSFLAFGPLCTFRSKLAAIRLRAPQVTLVGVLISVVLRIFKMHG